MENSKECPICFNKFAHVIENGDIVHGSCIDEDISKNIIKKDSTTSDKIQIDQKCKYCNHETCMMLLPCLHMFCGLCIHNDIKVQKKEQHMYRCSLCRSDTYDLVDIFVNPENGYKTFRIKNTLIPIEIILNKDLFAKFSDKLINKLNKRKFSNMLTSAFTP
jgi:hypothetical protein